MGFNSNKFKERALTIDSMGLLYILVVGGLCHILPIPEIVKGFLALPSLLIFYYLFGKCILHSTSKTLNNCWFLLKLKKIDTISQFVFFWLFGYFIITFLLYLLNAISIILIYELGVFFIQDYILKHLFLYIFLFISFYYILKYNDHNLSENRQGDLHNINKIGINSKTLLFFVLFAIVVVTISKTIIPFPYMGELYMTTGIYEHSTLRLLEEGYMSISIRYILVEFNSIAQVFFGLDSYTLNWVGPYLLFFLYVVGSYLLFYSISKNRFISLSGSVFGSLFAARIIDFATITPFKGTIFLMVLLPFVLFFIHNNFGFINRDTLKKDFYMLIVGSIIFAIIVLVSNIFHPSNFEMSTYQILLKYLFILILLLSLASFGMFYKKELFFTFLVISFATFSFHVQEFCLFGGVILLYCLGLWMAKLGLSYYRYLLILLTFLCFLFFIVQYFNIVNFEYVRYISKHLGAYSDIGSMGNFTFTNKFDMLKSATNSMIWLFAITFSFFISANRQEHIHTVFMVFMFSFIMFFYFFPETLTLRIEKFVCPFIGYVLGVGIFYFYSIFNKKYISSIVIFIFVITLFTTSLSPIYHSTLLPAGYQYYPKVADYEYEACNWMRNNLPKNTFLVTDRFSYMTLSPMSQKIYFLPLDMTSTMGETNEHDRKKWMLIKESFCESNSEQAYNNIKKLEKMPIEHVLERDYIKMKMIKDSKFENFSSVVVITGRTTRAFDHAKKLKNQNILPIAWYFSLDKVESESKYLKTFSDPNYFTLLYNDSDYIYIFGVNPEPGVPFKIQNNSNDY